MYSMCRFLLLFMLPVEQLELPQKCELPHDSAAQAQFLVCCRNPIQGRTARPQRGTPAWNRSMEPQRRR